MKIVTAAEIAESAGVTKQSITRLARQHRVGTRTRIGWIFSTEEASFLAAKVRSVGRPRKQGEK